MYSITNYTKQNAKQLGIQIKPSTIKNKKIDAFKDGHKICSVGDSRYYDFPIYLKQSAAIANEHSRLYHRVMPKIFRLLGHVDGMR